MLTYLAHFHLRGASETSSSNCGWAQGHFLGAYLGGGASGSTAVSEATHGWAQGHFLGAYLGAGVDGSAPSLDNFNGGWAQGSLFAYYYGAGAALPSGQQPGGGDSREEWLRLRGQIIREDSEFIEILAALIENEIIH